MATQDVLQAGTHLSNITLMSNTADGLFTQFLNICKY